MMLCMIVCMIYSVYDSIVHDSVHDDSVHDDSVHDIVHGPTETNEDPEGLCRVANHNHSLHPRLGGERSTEIPSPVGCGGHCH